MNLFLVASPLSVSKLTNVGPMDVITPFVPFCAPFLSRGSVTTTILSPTLAQSSLPLLQVIDLQEWLHYKSSYYNHEFLSSMLNYKFCCNIEQVHCATLLPSPSILNPTTYRNSVFNILQPICDDLLFDKVQLVELPGETTDQFLLHCTVFCQRVCSLSKIFITYCHFNISYHNCYM